MKGGGARGNDDDETAAVTTAAAIVAGGGARRMDGAVKPLLVVQGRRIIDRQLEVLAPLFVEIVLVANDAAPFEGLNVPVISDRVGPGRGPLAGLDAALAFFPPSIDAVLCVAGDMPFLQPPVLRLLRDAPPAPAVVPRVGGRPEPLCARYGRAFAPVVTAALARGELAIHAVLAGAGADITFIEEPALRSLDPALRTFINVNTPDDLLGDSSAST